MRSGYLPQVLWTTWMDEVNRDNVEGKKFKRS